MTRSLTWLAIASAALVAPSLPAQDEPPSPALLFGHIEGSTYYSPTGAFSMPIPVIPALGGTVSDTENDVLFQDPVSTYLTVWANRLDAGENGKLDVEGPKQYLQEYFQAYVYRAFLASDPNVKLEPNARFAPQQLGGAFFVYIDIPGGSALVPPFLQFGGGDSPVAKRGNLLFVHNGYIYVISMELAERITHAYHYSLTTEEENILLRNRLLAIAEHINFLSPAH